MGGATARPRVGICSGRVSGAAVAAGVRTSGTRTTRGTGRGPHRVRNRARVDVDREAGRAQSDPVAVQRALMATVQVGFERTLQQDTALGIRQLVDMACKALSPSVNDPYTAVQAIDHLSVIFCALAVRPLGDDVAAAPPGRGVVVVPGRRFGDYLATMCGLLRRYGCAEPSVSLALLGLLRKCTAVLADDPVRWAAVGEQTDLIRADATRETAQSADLTPVVTAAADLQRRVARHAAWSVSPEELG